MMQMIAQPTIRQCILSVRNAPLYMEDEPERTDIYMRAWYRRVCREANTWRDEDNAASACLIALTGRLVGLLTP